MPAIDARSNSRHCLISGRRFVCSVDKPGLIAAEKPLKKDRPIGSLAETNKAINQEGDSQYDEANEDIERMHKYGPHKPYLCSLECG